MRRLVEVRPQRAPGRKDRRAEEGAKTDADESGAEARPRSASAPSPTFRCDGRSAGYRRALSKPGQRDPPPGRLRRFLDRTGSALVPPFGRSCPRGPCRCVNRSSRDGRGITSRSGRVPSTTGETSSPVTTLSGDEAVHAPALPAHGTTGCKTVPFSTTVIFPPPLGDGLIEMPVPVSLPASAPGLLLSITVETAVARVWLPRSN
jgi:hypothetical protein